MTLGDVLEPSPSLSIDALEHELLLSQIDPAAH